MVSFSPNNIADDLFPILISSFLSTTSNANDQLYFKIGLWDFKHETGGLALNIKKVSNKNFKILNPVSYTHLTLPTKA